MKPLRAALSIAIWCVILSGCSQQSSLEEARNYSYRSDVFYRRAAAVYRRLSAAQAGLELGSLYYSHGDYESAEKELSALESPEAQRMLALTYYRMGRFTDALEVFNKNAQGDGEYLYYYGLTCEKLNLFDKSLEVYRRVKSGKFLSLCLSRIESIEKNTVYAQAAKDMQEMIKGAPGQAEYPDAGAVILFSREDAQITADNKEITSCHYAVKILNQRGKEEFSEARIEYDSTYEKVELEYARVIKPDGSVAEVGGRHLRDVSKYMNFPLYSNARVFIISFPEISEGAVLEYKFRVLRNELLAGSEFIDHYQLQESEPVLSADFILRLPPGREANIKLINRSFNVFAAELLPQVSKDKSGTVYRWSFRNIPQIIPEPQMPSPVEINPAILISSFNSWKQVYDWWDNLSRSKMSSDEAIRKQVKELLRKSRSDEEKARAVYNYCARKIRYVAVEYGQAGYEPHKAADIFRNKYGDCKDQSVLLVTMLREAGLKAWLVLIPTQDTYNLNRDFPAVIFDHCIAVVEIGATTVFMDPTAETCSFSDLPPADQQRSVLVFKEGNYEIMETPLYDSKHNLILQQMKLTLKPEGGIEALRKVSAHGAYGQGQRFWLQYTQPELIKEALNQKIQDISIGARLEWYNISNLDDLDLAVELSYLFKGEDYFIKAGNLRVLPQLAYWDTALVAREKRSYDIDFGMLERRESIQEIILPAGWKVRYLPESFSEESPWLKVDVVYSLKGNTLSFSQKSEIGIKKVSAVDYARFKEFCQRLARRIKQRIILEEAK